MSLVQSSYEFLETPQGALRLELYRSGGDRPTPLLVYLFGGGWMGGDRRQVQHSPLLGYVDHGYAVASLDYRHSQVATYPAQILDVKSGIGWLRRNATDLGIDASRVGVFGPSAGGHLAALVGTTSGTEYLVPDGYSVDDCRVQAVVDLFGPTDFLQMDAHSISEQIIHDASDSPESRLIGGAIQHYPDIVAAANPITYVDGSEPPFLVVHGDQDPLVPLHQSQLLVDALARVNARHRFIVVEGGGHGSGSLFNSNEMAADILDFLNRHLKR
ncbi:MAG: alpha/beta hydrolase [Pseudomonadota bacterium]